METKFNFNSQVCTTREQSERLQALGLKKETADMWYPHFASTCPIPFVDETLASDDIPAWSLHRLIQMIAYHVDIYGNGVVVMDEYFNDKDNLYGNLVDCIEWLIKEGYFNKEYLV